MPQSFDRQPGETSKAFAAFVEYLRLGPERSVDKAAANLKKGTATLRKWCERHGWVSRAADYDGFTLESEREIAAVVTKEKAVVWAKRQERLKELEWDAAEKALEKLREWLSGKIVIKSVRDAAYLLEIASKVGRLASGLATEHKEVTGEGGGPIQIDLTPALKRVYGTSPVGPQGSPALPEAKGDVIDVEPEMEGANAE